MRTCNFIWWWGTPKFKATAGDQTYNKLEAGDYISIKKMMFMK